MIVHPDFLDHWKTIKLIELTGDQSAPLLVIRLWAFCQIQKKSVFDDVPDLAGLCRSKFSTQELLDMFIACRFVRRDENQIVVHDWERSNRILRNSWDNGSRGGRPLKNKPTGSPQDTHGLKPTGSVQREKKRIEKVGTPRVSVETYRREEMPVQTDEQRNKVHQQFAASLADLSKKMRSRRKSR